jgi:hypothetical protein
MPNDPEPRPSSPALPLRLPPVSTGNNLPEPAFQSLPLSCQLLDIFCLSRHLKSLFTEEPRATEAEI